jgi:cyclic 2,3-diphosphoglycerate synthetase
VPEANLQTDLPRAICLIDGEHYLPVNQSGIEHVRRERGYDVVAAVFIGGVEKIGSPEDLRELGVPVIAERDPAKGIARGLDEYKPDVVVDLSDDPVVRPSDRFDYANLILSQDAIYEGADFRFEPPQYADIVEKPAISVVGTAKRVGKTAIAAYIARLLAASGGEFEPLIVTMGRGGPPEPEVIRGDQISLTPELLLEYAREGKHAASDHFEDALMSRVTTIGCRRCGGGFAGKVYHSVVPDGAVLANTMPHSFLIFEGSGPSLPPVRTDAWIITVGAHQGADYVERYMGPYRIRKSDLAIMTMCEEPMAEATRIDAVEQSLIKLKPDIGVVRTVFRPKPLGSLTQKRVVFATTAPPIIGAKLRDYLEREHNCSVVGLSHNLSRRPALREELSGLLRREKADTLLTELKAAAVDVATAMAVERGIEVVYADNAPVQAGDSDLDSAIWKVVRSAVERFQQGKRDVPGNG